LIEALPVGDLAGHWWGKTIAVQGDVCVGDDGSGWRMAAAQNSEALNDSVQWVSGLLVGVRQRTHARLVLHHHQRVRRACEAVSRACSAAPTALPGGAL